MKCTRIFFATLAFFVVGFIFSSVYASSTLGTIDPNNTGKFKALVENSSLGAATGINFGKFTTQSAQNITVSNSELRGFGWGEGIGWFVTNCLDTTSGCSGVNSNFKVANDGTGNLSGYAWGENTGWINFGPFTNSSVSTVKITNGLFGGTSGSAGYAWAQNFGWIKFDCSSAASCTETDWGVTTPPPATCSDGILNQNETSIDTGGVCGGGSTGGGGSGGSVGPQGFIKISAYTCPTRPTLSRALNGPNAQGNFVVPPTCTPLPGSEFGDVFMPGVYTGAGGYPYINGESLFDVLGITANLGELLKGGMSSLGRYNIAETYNGGIHLPNSSRYALFCYGDTGTWTDNLDYTFVPQNGTTYCVSYRSNDLCPNIAGDQPLVPSGAYINNAGDCITPPNPVDLCPNIAGTQSSIPNGKILNTAGQCVDVVIPDACPNIAGYQSSVPSDQQYDASGNCVPLTNATDMCLNIAGNQSIVPINMIRDGAGNCTTIPVDTCALNPGLCVNPPTPFCTTNPTDPTCVPVTPPSFCETHPLNPFCFFSPTPDTDVCPNINGPQATIPKGMILDGSGECVLGTIKVIEGDTMGQPNSSIFDGLLPILHMPYKLSTPFVKIITAIGIILPVAGTAVSFFIGHPYGVGDILLLVERGISSFLTAIGWKKRKKPWGIVYDSVSKRPIDPAYVVLMDIFGNEIATAITDIDGRYGFAVEPGTYKIMANKTNYAFPSTKLTGRSSDGVYDDLYFGSEITVTKEDEIITKNIPLDQLAFDWNEYAKTQAGGTHGQKLHFYRNADAILRRLSQLFFIAGFAFSIYAVIISPSLYNWVILGLYVILTIVQSMTTFLHAKGSVLSRFTGEALPYSVVRLTSTATNREVAHKVADRIGNYYGLVPNGTYSITVDTKKDEQNYDKHQIENPVVVKKGYLKEKFKV